MKQQKNYWLLAWAAPSGGWWWHWRYTSVPASATCSSRRKGCNGTPGWFKFDGWYGCSRRRNYCRCCCGRQRCFIFIEYMQVSPQGNITHYMNAALLMQITKLLHGHWTELYVLQCNRLFIWTGEANTLHLGQKKMLIRLLALSAPDKG